MRSLHAAILLFALLAVAPAAESSTTAAATNGCPACDMSMSVRSARVATTVGVSATEYEFTNMSTTINAGDTVTWTNNGTVVHTSTSDTLVWDSQDLAPGASYSFTFPNAGTFSYHCRYHGAGQHMVGTITVSAMAPVITSANAASGTVNTPFTYTITAANTPTSFGASGLPSGLSLTPSTGVISGVPTVAGTFSIGLSALNSGGIGTETLTLTVASPPPGSPVITSPTVVTGTVGVGFAYGITATGLPTVFGATNLPSGLGIDTTTGQITGTPLVVSSNVVTLSATNSFGTGAATATFTMVANGSTTTDLVSSATGGACGLGAGPAAFALLVLALLHATFWRHRRRPPA